MGHVLVNLFLVDAVDVPMLVALDKFALVEVHNEAAVVADVFAGIVFDAVVHVPFGVEEDLLAAFFVFEAELVVVGGRAAFGAAGHKGRASFVVGERIRGHLVVVVDPAGNDGAVGVAF